MRRFIGIDYSMTSPAVSVIHAETNFFESHFIASNKKQLGDLKPHLFGYEPLLYNSDMQRFDVLSNWIMNCCEPTENDVVCIEGYSMGSVGQVFTIAENTAILKYKLYEKSIKYNIVPPTTLKKYATGKGNADKLMMYEAFVNKTGIDPRKILNSSAKLSSPFTDIADSFWLASYAQNAVT